MMSLQKHRQRLKTYWQSSTPPQRFTLALASLLLAILMFYFLIIAPWIALQNKLDNALPRLRNDLVNMKQMAKQQASLSSTLKTVGDSHQLQADLLSQFNPPNAPEPIAALRNDGTERLHLTINQGDFDDILARLAAIQKKYPVRIVTAKFTRLTNTTQVKTEIILELPTQQ